MASLFLEACRRRPVSRTPVWFMRQAGRYMLEYRKIRAAHSILEMCKRPDLAAEVTLQPIEVLGVDAAIIFADLLLPVEPMGLKLEFVKGEGPAIHNPVRTMRDAESLDTSRSAELGYVAEAISCVKKALNGKVPVIGFVGAPFTLASYMIEGGGSRHYLHTKRMMYAEPETWDRLMRAIVEVLAPYGESQIAGGADAMQVFDSWVGALAPGDYERYVLPYSRELIGRLRAAGVPVIHFGTGAGTFAGLLRDAGGDVIGLDWRVHLDRAWEEIGHDTAVQGNLDPLALFAPLAEIRRRVQDILHRAARRPGHIFNLGHGILPETPVENVKAVVEMVRELTS